MVMLFIRLVVQEATETLIYLFTTTQIASKSIFYQVSYPSHVPWVHKHTWTNMNPENVQDYRPYSNFSLLLCISFKSIRPFDLLNQKYTDEDFSLTFLMCLIILSQLFRKFWSWWIRITATKLAFSWRSALMASIFLSWQAFFEYLPLKD